MNKRSLITILLILLLPVLLFFCLSFNQDSSTVAEAVTSDKPQVIKFSSSMCLECKEVEKIFNEIMPKYINKVDYVEIIVDSRKDMKNSLIKKHNVKLVPTVVMINTDGSIKGRFEGARPKDEFETCIKGLR